jgi:hypothetical protein
MILTPICVRFSPFRCRSPRFFRRAPPSSWKKLSDAPTHATPRPPHSGPWARAYYPTMGAPAPLLLAIAHLLLPSEAHRLLPSGAIAPAAAAPTTSPTPSAAEAADAATDAVVGAAVTIPGSSIPGRGPLLVPSYSRPRGSHLHQHSGSRARQQHGSRRPQASSARAPA